METKSLIITTFEKLLHFFEKHQVSGWTQRSKQAIERIRKEQNYKTVLNDFIGTGPGSLTDLYLCVENGHFIVGSTEEANKQLQILSTEILTIRHRIR